MFLHSFIKFWLIGAVLIAFNIYFTIKDDPIINYKYNTMTKLQKLLTFAQLFAICVIGSWIVVIWRIITFILIKYLRR